MADISILQLPPATSVSANDVTVVVQDGITKKVAASVFQSGIVGPAGPAGPQGPQGLPGTPGAQGPVGPQGPGGPQGDTGATGATGAPGPGGPQGIQGVPGPSGATGAAATVDAGSTITTGPGTSALVSNVGTTSAAVFNFSIPRGDTGATGDTGPQGATGAPGTAATIAAGTTTTLAPGSSATVVNTGTSNAAVFDFGIPQGLTGATGPIGMEWKGNWNSSNLYAINDGVFDAASGSSYIAIAANTNQQPPNVLYWDLLAQKGANGAGSGNVIGPASSTDNALARYDGITGELIKNSVAILSDAGALGTANTTSDFFAWNLAAGVTPAVGQRAWDASQGTTALGLLGGNVISRDGQSLVAYVTNAEAVTITKGQAVYLFSAQGDRASVKLAYNTGDATSAKTLGIVAEDIAAGQTGFIMCQGVAYKLNTGTYTAGDSLYLGATPGSLTTTKPYAPNHLVYMGTVERANNGNGQIYVRVQNGYELDELHNVSAQTPTTGQTIVYNSATSLWEQNTVSLTAGVNGILPAANGGTGQSSYAVGDLLFASSSSALSKLADVATGNALISGGVGVAPLWGKIGLTTHVSGTLPVANGGTGTTTPSLVAGSNISVTGTWPNQTISSTTSITYPAAGVVVSTGSAWGTSLSPAPTSALVGITDTQTLTNKRITPRIYSAATAATPFTWNSDSYDQIELTAVDSLLNISADSGTPTDGQTIVFRLVGSSTGSVYVISWPYGLDKGVRQANSSLPITLTSKTMYITFTFNSTSNTWDSTQTSQEP